MKKCDGCGTTDPMGKWAYPRTKIIGVGKDMQVVSKNSTLCTPCREEHDKVRALYHSRKQHGSLVNDEKVVEQKECDCCGRGVDVSSARSTRLAMTNGVVDIGDSPRLVCEACSKKLQNRRKKQMERRDPEAYRFKRLREKYKITREDFDRIKGDRLCEICGGDNGGRTLMLDHCHDTGQIRGMLCRGCNHALGHFRDDLELMSKADFYLEAHEYKIRGVDL